MSTETTSQPSARENVALDHAYVKVAAVLLAFGAWLLAITSHSPSPLVADHALLGPIIALVAVTFGVCVLMAVVRNFAVIRGLTPLVGYVDHRLKRGGDWIERPARTFDNLLQVPTLFYLVCVLMMMMHAVDRTQLMLAWTFVVLRAAHAVVYIGWNAVHYRFATWIAGCIALATMWIRFAT
jgi:hypothetical protein